jgi:hypothetical protein
MRTLTTAIVYMMLALCTGTAMAQDRIITMEGEQISCRIIEQDSLNVVYMLHQPGAVSEAMPRYRIFRIDINVPEEIHWVRKYRKAWESSRGNKMKGFRLAAGAGNAALLLPVTGDPSYTGSRTHGFNIKVEGTYFFGRFFGLGARYSMFRLHTLFLHYVSLNPTLRVPIRKGRAHFLCGFSGGYLQKALSSPRGIWGYRDTFGGAFGGGFDVRIIPKLYIGLSGEFIVGFIDTRRTSFFWNTEVYRENLSRVDATLGLSYYF